MAGLTPTSSEEASRPPNLPAPGPESRLFIKSVARYRLAASKIYRMDTRKKILSLEQTADLIPALASNGGIAAAKGWFDILRAAHCDAMAEAKKGAAHLIVAVYADAGSRPTILDESARAQLVAALRMVDYVVICDEAKTGSLIASWRPAAVVDAEQAVTGDLIHDVLQRYRPA